MTRFVAASARSHSSRTRLDLGEGLGPPEDGRHERGLDEQGLEGLEARSQHGGAVYRIAQLPQDVESLQGQGLGIRRLGNGPPRREQRCSRRGRGAVDPLQQLGQAGVVDPVGHVLLGPGVQAQREFPRRVVSGQQRPGALPRLGHGDRVEEDEGGGHHHAVDIAQRPAASGGVEVDPVEAELPAALVGLAVEHEAGGKVGDRIRVGACSIFGLHDHAPVIRRPATLPAALRR